jgi:hypothetical protein
MRRSAQRHFSGVGFGPNQFQPWISQPAAPFFSTNVISQRMARRTREPRLHRSGEAPLRAVRETDETGLVRSLRLPDERRDAQSRVRQ